MQNSTDPHPEFFKLTYGQLTSIRYFYGTLLLIGLLLTVLSNGVIVIAVVSNQTLHEPMYVFICALCINGIIESIFFYPSILVTLFKEVPIISYSFCLLQVFLVYIYGIFELVTLTAMALDRYLCICKPLRYNKIMTLSTVFKILTTSWLTIVIMFGTHLLLTYRLPLCDNEILKIYCDNWSIVRLSCIDTTVNNIYGLFLVSIYICLVLVFILCSYIAILRVCVRSTLTLSKAFKTCIPQVITTINFLTASLFDILLYRYIPTIVPYEFRVFMSLEFLLVSPILNSFVYGLRMAELKVKILQLLPQKSIKTHT
ncbi:hypothetical protein GDO86_004803 [Hymenochirus boettgeri]|uniref:Olfactory receptor n=1 Tax=Hymenochirus boettgeri TaxID=247094 RepID=A0A8T2KBZ3_9PIPI|nr:hypothetical protein GDO86_004803 [Hymenochirus boettgeri]